MVEAGGVASVDVVARLSPDCRVPGWTPMSASRLTVACCILGSAAELPRSWTASRPHAHWIVPAPKTRAPLAALYMVKEWVAVPLA